MLLSGQVAEFNAAGDRFLASRLGAVAADLERRLGELAGRVDLLDATKGGRSAEWQPHM